MNGIRKTTFYETIIIIKRLLPSPQGVDEQLISFYQDLFVCLDELHLPRLRPTGEKNYLIEVDFA
jgi:hypothetical protein